MEHPQSLILTGAGIGRALEHAEANHLRRHVETYRQLTHRESVRNIAVCGGVAALTETVFGRKLNHVTGLGMGSPVCAKPMEELERAYAQMDLDVEIDLCPHTHSTALAVLAERGYIVHAFSNTYVRRLTDADANAAPTDTIEIVAEKALVKGISVSHSIEGFAVQAVPRPAILLDTLARIAVTRAYTVLFVARLDGKIAGTAGISLLDTPAGKIAHLHIASTLPAYRGRGIQLALLRARLSAARCAGCVMASVTARPANTSARNAERVGFTLAYTKSTFVKRHQDIAIG